MNKLFIFIKKNLLLTIVISCVLVIGIIGVVVILNNNKNNDTNTEISLNTSTDLPDLISIDSNANPMLYDFVNSSLGYKLCEKGYNFNLFGVYFAVLQNSKKPENIYVEYYNYADAIRFPILGSKPIQYTLNKEEEISIKDYSESLSENRIIKEGNWNLYIISQDNTYTTENDFDFCDKIGRWGNVDFIQFRSNEAGEMKLLIESGFGWPTSWLRNEFYIEGTKYAGFDVNNDFWDKYNIKSYKIYKNKDGEELKVTVSQIDTFEFMVGEQNVQLNEDEFLDFLKTQGWE